MGLNVDRAMLSDSWQIVCYVDDRVGTVTVVCVTCDRRQLTGSIQLDTG